MSHKSPATSSSPNHSLLREINATKTWKHVRKNKAIWVKQLERPEAVMTLEGPLHAKAGDFLCRGVVGEIWPQSEKTLKARYLPTATVDAEGWTKYEPRSDAEGAMAAQVPHAFSVVATWGTLHGKAGDYVLKQFSARAEPYPIDVWIVDQKLFHATYEVVSP